MTSVTLTRICSYQYAATEVWWGAPVGLSLPIRVFDPSRALMYILNHAFSPRLGT